MSLILDEQFLSGFVTQSELEACIGPLEAARESLHAQDGHPKGWRTLPEETGEDLLSAVEAAARTIREEADILLGIGIGGSFDKAACLAKHALLRPIDQPNSDPFYAQLEEELLEEINALGIGPQGFGGKTTCLGLSIETAPTHVAGLPVAVNVSCHVTRRASAQL